MSARAIPVSAFVAPTPPVTMLTLRLLVNSPLVSAMNVALSSWMVNLLIMRFSSR